MTALSLVRKVFKTSRLAEFCSKKVLVNQTGHDSDDWPLVVLKELIDNALDACEEAGAAPVIHVAVSDTEIAVFDNGQGIALETVAGILDYNTRRSSREAYVSPTRGAQGNALKTLLGMPFALDRERGETTLESQGVAHRITFSIDPIRQEPRLVRVCEGGSVKSGTRVAVSWPISASSILDDAQAAFLRIAEDYTWVNPHLTLTVKWDRDGCDPVQWAIPATDPTWRKWRPSDPTSPHWYDVPRLARLIANNIAYAQDHDIPCRTIWDFVREFRGLSATVKAKAICETVSASRLSLTQFYAPSLPAHRIFGSRQIEREPAMSLSPAKAIADLIEGVTEKWAKQRKAEERDSSARLRRDDRFVYYARPISLKGAAYRVMERAYMAASAGGTLPANPRQIMYAARPEILKIAERDNLDSQYFCQTLLPDYIREYRSTCAGWDIAWDDRGHFVEPHTGKAFGLGTLNVRDYVARYASPAFEDAGFADAAIKTHGPEGRYGGVLYIEKEGFMPLLERARLAEKYDVAIMSCKGMSVTAARQLIDRTCARYGIPLLILHDFDISGFSIAKTLCSDTRRYTFKNEFETSDLGIRLDDVHELGLVSEPVSFGNASEEKIRDRLEHNGATEAEIDFLMEGQRVELNAMTSDQFVAFVEDKLTKAGIAKVVPPKDQLAEAYRLIARSKEIEEAVEKAIAELDDEEIGIPDDFEDLVRDYLAEHPDEPWEGAVRDAAGVAQ